MAKKSKIQSWAEKCADSNGTMMMLPDGLHDESDKFQKESDAYLELAREFDKKTAEFEVFAKNFWHKIRLELEKKGVKEIFAKNIGFNEQAKKDSVKVINLTSGPMQMR